MLYRLLADLVVLAHFAFALFSVFGGFCVLKWRRVAWIHVPVALWAVTIEFTGWGCPLTPLEDWLRVKSGATGYNLGLVEHYILPLIYPSPLTRGLQIVLGAIVLSLNAVLYAWVLRLVIRNRT